MGSLYTTAVTGISVAASDVTTVLNWRQNGRTFRLVDWAVSFNGVTSSDAAFQVALLNQDQTGTKTDATEVEWNTGDDAVDATAHHTYTVEPATNGVLEEHYLTPNSGLLRVQYPLGREPVAQTGEALGLRVTAPSGITTVSCAVHMVIEE